MSKPPAFQFYASDFLTDYKLAVMSMSARGVYITLLAHAWLEQGLPNDEIMLSRLCGNPDDWDEVWKEVRMCFSPIDGRLYNDRMEIERSQLSSYIESRKIAGKKGAQVRWGTSSNTEDKHGKRIAEPKQTHSSSSSTSTTTSNSKKRNRHIEEFWENDFEEFWDVVLNKKDKKRALKAYMIARSKGVTNPTLISTYKEQAVANRSEWTKDRGKYCPHPSTWLNGERWLDEIAEESDEDKNGDAPIIKKITMICPLCDVKEKQERGLWSFCQKGHKRIKMIPEGEMALQHIQEYVTAIREEEGV